MRNYLLCLGVGTCLVVLLSVRVPETRAADDADPVKELKKDSKDATAKKCDDMVKETAPLTKMDAEQVMHLMSKRNPANNKGGIGIGPKAGVIDPDGIEAKIINMIRQGIPASEMPHAADFKKMADQIAAIAAATHGQKHEKKKEDADGAIWKKSSQDMYEKAKDLAKAVDSKDQTKIKAAAKALDGTCKDCHGPYRP